MSDPKPNDPTLPPFTPTRVKTPRFQIRITDFYVLMAFVLFHLAIWGHPKRPGMIANVLIATTGGWLLMLWIAQERLRRFWRTARLVVYMSALAVPLTVWFGFSTLGYIKEEIHARRTQESKYAFVRLALIHAWNNRKGAASNAPVLSLSDLAGNNSSKNPVLDAACSDPLHPSGAIPFNGYWIKMLKSRPGVSEQDLFGSWPLKVPIVIYPASYSDLYALTYLIDEAGEECAVDFGPNTHEKVSKLEVVDPKDWPPR